MSGLDPTRSIVAAIFDEVRSIRRKEGFQKNVDAIGQRAVGWEMESPARKKLCLQGAPFRRMQLSTKREITLRP
jgi:hypothetical protein